MKTQNELFHLDSLESLTEEYSRGLPNTPLLNRLQSNDVENTAVIVAPGTVFLPVETVQRRNDDNNESQDQSVINESQDVQRSSYEEEDVRGANVTIQEEEVDESDGERTALTTTL